MSGFKDQLGDVLYEEKYPRTPGYKAPGTSQEAAARIAPKVSGLRQKVLDSLKAEGPGTPDEVAARLNISILSIRPRFSELSELGLIRATGIRRRNASGHAADEYEVNS